MIYKNKQQTGVTLMEVLITMVIVLFGLVGLSQLFLKAQRTTIEAYDRHRALALANQMAEMTRTMLRSTDTFGAVGTDADRCPPVGSMPSNGILSNEQLMSCFEELSKPGNNRSLGRFTGEDQNAITEPDVLKAALIDCTNVTGCDNREMVLYLLNNWTESLAGYSQAAAGAGAGQVFANRGFSARGCIDRICNSAGRTAGCGTGEILENVFRVRVYWRADEPIAHDEAFHYCDEADVDDFWRYTFVDVAISSPSIVQ